MTDAQRKPRLFTPAAYLAASQTKNSSSETDMDGNDIGKCPVMHGAPMHTSVSVRSNKDWWPNALNIDILHQHDARQNPMDPDFDYRDAV